MNLERLISVNNEYASLDKIEQYLKDNTPFEIKQDYDAWDVRTDANGQMEKCVIIKKSGMHGAKVYFSSGNTMRVTFLIPSKMMNAFFGKNQQKYQTIVDIITGKIKDLFLSGSQKKSFEEITKYFDKIAV